MLLTIIYLAFISLGLPDSLLGSAWPMMYKEFDVAVSLAGMVSIVIALGTVVSSLFSDRLTNHLGTAKVTTISVVLTCIALFGFSISGEFWMLCLWAIPYGLGAGSVDVALNNYVAIHYASWHMSWLHCMWGIGASAGPYIMGYVLSGGQTWRRGYRSIAWIQLVLSVVLLLSLPLWRRHEQMKQKEESKPVRSLRLREVVRIPGAKQVMVTFFAYCAIEQTTGLWASSYLVMKDGVSPVLAARYASLFFIGVTAGRAINGFLAMRMNDRHMIRMGEGIVLLGIVTMLLPFGSTVTMISLIMIGLGCAPIYPCLIHSTPYHFGEEHSRAIIGIQMASSYFGICVMPPLFGLIANHINVALLPWFLMVSLAGLWVMYESMRRKTVK